MAVQYKIVTTCDVPACPFSAEEAAPDGWSSISSEEMGSGSSDCSCECHTCPPGEEQKAAGHWEDGCRCNDEDNTFTIVMCPNHSADFRRRYR